MGEVSIIGLDLAKNVFQAHGADASAHLYRQSQIFDREGLDVVADPSNVVIFRTDKDTRYVGKFDLNRIRDGKDGDPLLQNGDVVMVDSSGMRTVLRDWSPALSGLGGTAAFIGVLK